MTPSQLHLVGPELAGLTLAAALRRWRRGTTWTEARGAVAARLVKVNGSLTLDDARRLRAGETVEWLGRPAPPPPGAGRVVVRYVDEHLVVVEKPAGVQTVRRREERGWDERRKAKQPTLDELVAELLPGRNTGASPARRVRVVHRLDRDTSGLMLFALSPTAETRLTAMFAAHEVERVYTAVVQGILREPRAIETRIVRDRGDGSRGSLPAGADSPDAKRAVTHVRPIRPVGERFTVVECRLETGRTHQIRIHMSEIGHRLCGEALYTHSFGQPPFSDDSGAPRQALHSTSLRLVHPMTGRPLAYECPLPRDLSNWLRSVETP